jgi:hypothetical protein
MRDLVLERKTGFQTSLPFTILDNKGVLFYDDTFVDKIARGEVLKFNLPAGVYKYNGSFIKLDSPVTTKTIILPPKERHIAGDMKRYKIEFGDNPNKCTIYYDLGLILFDNEFINAPLYIKYGIYFHELGHHWYKTEWKADLYATKKMLEYGFNPSQIGRVGLMTLSNNSFDRKEKTIKVLTS